MAKDLTEKQKQVLKGIKDYIRKRGFSPSIRDVAADNNINTANGAKSILVALEKKGFIRRGAKIARSIVVIEK